MKPLRQVGVFCALSIVWLGVLMAPWPGLESFYARSFRACCNSMLGHFWQDGSARFRPSPQDGAKYDTRVTLTNERTGFTADLTCDSRFLGFVPTALVVSLTLASPIPWLRRLRALAWVLLGTILFIASRILLLQLQVFAGNNPISLFTPSETREMLIGLAFSIFVVSSAGSFLVPALIWFVVAGRQTPWAELLAARTTNDKPQDRHGREDVRQPKQPGAES